MVMFERNPLLGTPLKKKKILQFEYSFNHFHKLKSKKEKKNEKLLHLVRITLESIFGEQVKFFTVQLGDIHFPLLYLSLDC